ncbi:hypothetical protein BaRGS_00005243, partial [Batillaria attramentaria]
MRTPQLASQDLGFWQKVQESAKQMPSNGIVDTAEPQSMKHEEADSETWHCWILGLGRKCRKARNDSPVMIRDDDCRDLYTRHRQVSTQYNTGSPGRHPSVQRKCLSRRPSADLFTTTNKNIYKENAVLAEWWETSPQK